MHLEIPYGLQSEKVVWNARYAPDRVGRVAGGVADPAPLIRQACAQPVDSVPLDEFLRRARDLLVVINDATRATPTGTILHALREKLAAVPRVKIVVATGLHRAPNDDEYRTLLGPTHDDFRAVCFAHDGNKPEELEWVDGGEQRVLINPSVPAADRILVINSVEPHFFAGYTAGRKSFLPGLAGYPSVEASHAGAVAEAAAPLRVAGNPIREFIDRNTGFIDCAKVFALQVVLDRDDKIARVYAGNIDSTFRLACAVAHKFYTMPVHRRYEIVLALVRPPLDINLYQTEKAWEHARYGLVQGGILICVSRCREGAGSDFYQRLNVEYPDHAQWLELEHQPYRMGLHKLVRTARMWRQGDLWVVSDVDEDTARRAWYEPKPSVQQALDDALAKQGREASLLIIDDAALTVPVVVE